MGVGSSSGSVKSLGPESLLQRVGASTRGRSHERLLGTGRPRGRMDARLRVAFQLTWLLALADPSLLFMLPKGHRGPGHTGPH